MITKRVLQANAVERDEVGAPQRGTMHGDDVRCVSADEMKEVYRA